MAKESEELPVTLEVRRFSAGKSYSGNTGEKIVSHYLRTSTGSCDDFCKYGRKHAFEAKEWRVGGWMTEERETKRSLFLEL